MNDLEYLLKALGSAADLLTTAYRAAYASASGRDNSPTALVALATWFSGTLITIAVLALLAFAWHAAVSALRGWARALLHRATLGANLRLTHTLVDRFVRLDRMAGVIQRLSRVKHRLPEASSPSAFTRPRRGSRLSVLLLLTPSAFGWLVGAVRSVFTTAWGILTLAATWWAMGRPGLATVYEWVQYSHDGNSALMTTAGLSVIGLTVAVLTFMLGRLRGRTSIGRQSWRRDESSRACDELADREIAISRALIQLDAAEWAIHSSWKCTIRDFQDAGSRALADHEAQLRRILLLPKNPPTRQIAPWKRPLLSHDPREVARNQTAAALRKLRKHLRGVTDRRETRLRRAAPWGVVQFTTRLSLNRAISKIEGYVTISRSEPQLTPAEIQARCLQATASGMLFAPLAEDFDFTSIPEPDRLAAVARAKKEWLAEIDRGKQNLEDTAHRAVIRGLIGIAELQTASHRIFAYLHPTGPLNRLLEWLRPA